MKEHDLDKKNAGKKVENDIMKDGMLVGQDLEDVVQRVLNHETSEGGEPDQELLDQIDLDEVESYINLLKKEKRHRIVYLISGIGIFLVCLAIIIISGYYRSHKLVEDIVGMDSEEAIQVLYDQGFAAKISKDYDEKIPQGLVIKQSVEPGTRMHVGEIITLTVSDGRKPVAIKNVVGRGKKVAARILEKQGIHVILEQEYSDDVPVRMVIKMVPKAGTKLVPGQGEVTIVASRGPQKIVLPDVNDMKEADAIKALEDKGFKVVRKKAYASITEKGLVCLTDPQYKEGKDTKLTKGSEVIIYISQGPDPKAIVKNPNSKKEQGEQTGSDQNNEANVEETITIIE